MSNVIKRPVALLGIFALLSLTAGTAPSTQPAGGMKELDDAFAAKASALRKEYHEKLAAARKERLKGLQALLDRAMDDKDLDKAIAVRDKIREAEKEIQSDDAEGSDQVVAEDAPAKLTRQLAGTTWTWGGGKIKFNEDGTVYNDGWAAAGLETTWKVVDGNTVKLQNRTGTAVLHFSAEFDSYSGVSFEGNTITEEHPVPK